MAAKDELGRRGEAIAAEYLTEQGLVILARNWRCSEGELDIVATDGADTVIFCEVKTRSGITFGTPVEAVTRAKRCRIRRLAYLWMTTIRPRGWPKMRFDIVGIVIRARAEPELTHLAGAF
ncbi:MAG: YraN family protein [Nakamurella sp.]